ncbi:uncharacterized protein ASCRUDRAFT_75636 [Ascoidea rubescens DSM 1968]|uniref:Ras-domain-containing protein n=1 Tax=Ascoidea rubescens DSM 1968 TaxID=1344418 RepID=A0A1D2VJ43_9ASCO|nr:hypothetical protein ASCRUDRAFT_75636 [Ascoidea rubescens DSM 1968]ODV61652.1 hypothetical protein ASCRUDRAFT_75636 [Ascoidea rubescens DSM 1968]
MNKPGISRKLAVVGARGVGKSSLTARYTQEKFLDSYYPTIENQFSKDVTIDKKLYNLEILDTAGQDEYSMMNDKHLIGIHGYILIYSVTSRSSFELISTIREKIVDSIIPLSDGDSVDIPFVIVGNKTDLNALRQVPTTEGEELGKKFNCPFIEVSAKDNINVDKCFKLVLTTVNKFIDPPISKESNCSIV